MDIEKLVIDAKNNGLSDSDIISALMSGVYALAKENSEQADNIFQEAQRILEQKKTGYNSQRAA